MKWSIPLYPWTNFERQRYYQNGSRLNGVYLQYSLLNKASADVNMMSTNRNSVQVRGAALYANGNDAIYFEKFGN